MSISNGFPYCMCLSGRDKNETPHDTGHRSGSKAAHNQSSQKRVTSPSTFNDSSKSHNKKKRHNSRSRSYENVREDRQSDASSDDSSTPRKRRSMPAHDEELVAAIEIVVERTMTNVVGDLKADLAKMMRAVLREETNKSLPSKRDFNELGTNDAVNL